MDLRPADHRCGRARRAAGTADVVHRCQPERVFAEFSYCTRKRKNGGWDRERRVVAKAEHIDGMENPRFVVTSLSAKQWAAQSLYEDLYCAR